MQLSDRLANKFRLNEIQKRALNKIKVLYVLDLLFLFPVRYSDISLVKKISELIPGETATIYGKIANLKTKKGWKTKIPMGEGEIEDVSGKIKIIWFHQAYLAKILREGDMVKLTGKVTEGKGGPYLANPEFEKVMDMPIDSHDTLFRPSPQPSPQGRGSESSFPLGGGREGVGFSYPVYAEARGITSKWFYHCVEKVLKDKTLDNISDYVPADILKKYNLPSLRTALIWIHRPRSRQNAESARKRFAFEEVFTIQLHRQRDKLAYQKNKSFQIKPDEKSVKEFLQRFPFTATNSQKKSIEVILKDMSRNFPMSRLLEGDVGSGKTAVAATASYITVKQRPFDYVQGELQNFGNLQVAYMAPTEILATQHFESFIEYFSAKGGSAFGGKPILSIGLITGSGCRKFPSKLNPASWTTISRTQLLKWVANGEIPILIGTHALIQKTVKFKNLALVVIDEQHRFGTAQRRKLVRKDAKGNTSAPHLLSMTATPIPRTLALTIYGDLDLSMLDEMPAGRKQIITEIITPNKRAETYEKIRAEIKNGRQLYVICPRIFEPEEAEAEFSF